jgi:hypothetical protein
MVEQCWYTGAVQMIVDRADSLDAAGQTEEALELDFALLRLAAHCRQASQPQGILFGSTIEQLVGDQLLVWANRPARKSEAIRAVVRRLEGEVSGSPPNFEAEGRNTYELNRETITFHNDTLRKELGERSATTLRWLMRLMPWEAARTKRLIALWADDEVRQFRALAPALTQGWPYEGFPSTYGHQLAHRWRSTTLLAAFMVSPGWTNALADVLFQAETRRRVLPAQLALIAYRSEHGRLPEQLDELVGEYLREVPLDPYATTQIVYQPQGCDELLYRAHFAGERWVGSDRESLPAERRLPPGTPFLWVTGPKVLPRAEREQVRGQRIDPPSYDRYWQRWDNPHENRPLESQTPLWRSGWVMPLTPPPSKTGEPETS